MVFFVYECLPEYLTPFVKCKLKNNIFALQRSKKANLLVLVISCYPIAYIDFLNDCLQNTEITFNERFKKTLSEILFDNF